jgi:hypothetical protein
VSASREWEEWEGVRNVIIVKNVRLVSASREWEEWEGVRNVRIVKNVRL